MEVDTDSSTESSPVATIAESQSPHAPPANSPPTAAALSSHAQSANLPALTAMDEMGRFSHSPFTDLSPSSSNQSPSTSVNTPAFDSSISYSHVPCAPSSPPMPVDLFSQLTSTMSADSSSLATAAEAPLSSFNKVHALSATPDMAQWPHASLSDLSWYMTNGWITEAPENRLLPASSVSFLRSWLLLRRTTTNMFLNQGATTYPSTLPDNFSDNSPFRSNSAQQLPHDQNIVNTVDFTQHAFTEDSSWNPSLWTGPISSMH